MSRRREIFRPDAGAADCLVALVVSAADGAGKTVAVANTALTAAAEGARVLALDADLGHQGLSALFEGGGDTKTVVTAAGSLPTGSLWSTVGGSTWSVPSTSPKAGSRCWPRSRERNCSRS